MGTDGEGGGTIAFLLYPGLTPLDMIGPLQVLGGLHTVAPEWKTVVVGERLQPVDSDVGVRLSPQATFEDVPAPDVLLVPGGGAPTIRAMGDEGIRGYILGAAEGAHVVGSVCTGALLLAAAGLLEGRRATTHWGYHMLLERLGATYVPERWVEDGGFMTSAGVSAGIDMALELAARLTDEGRARLVQLGIEYDPHPPQGPIEWERVDRNLLQPVVEQHVRGELTHRPELQRRLLRDQDGTRRGAG
jgi:transcriptional regulator GlxA family with amidase domain